MSKPFRTLDDADVAGKRVLLRVDLNVPTENGKVTDTTRIERVASTITEIADKGGKVILLAHFGRPKGGPDEAEFAAARRRGGRRGHRGEPVGFADRLPRRRRRRRHRQDEGRRHPAAREHPLLQGRGKERPGHRRGARQARRPLRQRRLFRRPSRPRLDRGRRPQAAGLRRPRHAGRTRGADDRARQSRSARSPRSSAAPRSRPSSNCSAI